MKLVGLMCVRSEEWVLEASMRAALAWVDELIVVDHNSHDATFEIINKLSGEFNWRIQYSLWRPTEEKVLTSRYPGSRTILNATPSDTWTAQVPSEDESLWNEMDMRQHSLLLGRKHGGTHFAMIDADEILTSNILDRVREDVRKLNPTEVLDYPLYAMRSLDEFQDDDTEWSRGVMSTVFADAPHITWRPAGDGYHFHARCPQGSGKRITPLGWKDGGVMHLQFANRRRLVAKHIHYAMTEHIRWPGRSTPEQLNQKYGNALRAPKHISVVPESWWWGYPRELITLSGWPWYEGEIYRLLEKHGKSFFAGLDLRGF